MPNATPGSPWADTPWDDGDMLAHWVRRERVEAAAARALTAARLARFGLAVAQLDDAALMVSELTANAAQHGRCPVDLLAWRCDLGYAVVEVHDSAVRAPAPLPATTPLADIPFDSESGRGLALVTELSRHLCGSTPFPGGCAKSAWFALPIPGLPDRATAVRVPSALLLREAVEARIWMRDVSRHPELWPRPVCVAS